MGQTLALLGSPDPRLDPLSSGKLDYRLRSMLRNYRLTDPAPARIKPIPVPILIAATVSTQHLSLATQSAGDMICIGLYYLCRPGEYAVSSEASLSTPFRLADVELFVGRTRLDFVTAPEDDLRSASYAILTFTLQKNTVPGEKIGHARSGHPYFCPVLALVRRVLHLRQHGATPTTPLHCYYTRQTRHDLHVQAVTTLLRKAVALQGAEYGITAKDVEARSLRSSGAMALLCARVDPDLIQLVGRWRSDAMFRYLQFGTQNASIW